MSIMWYLVKKFSINKVNLEFVYFSPVQSTLAPNRTLCLGNQPKNSYLPEKTFICETHYIILVIVG